MFQQYFVGFFSALAVALVTLVVLWDVSQPLHLLVWFGAVCLVLGVRFVIVYGAISNRRPDEFRFWYKRYRLFLITAFLLGTTWGLLGTALFPQKNDAYQAFVIVILAGMSSGALPLMFPVKEVFLAFVVPILLPFTLNLMFKQDKAYLAISFLTLFYFTGMYLIARRGEHSVIEAIKLRFENVDLIDELEEAKIGLTIAKDELESRVKERTAKLEHVSDELSRQKELAETTLKSIADGIITTDTDGRIQYMNASAEILTGFSLDELSGKRCSEYILLIDEQENMPIENPVEKAIRERRTINTLSQCLLVNKTNTSIAVKESIAPIFDQAGEVMGTVIVLHNVNQERMYRLQLAHQAKHDTLTGLYNRFAFEENLKKLLLDKDKRNQQHAVIYIDLDEFKIVNDVCGHAAGDELLKQLSLILPRSLQSADMFARLGGDEFGVILTDSNVKKSEKLCEQILRQLREFHFVWQDKTFNVGASIGLFIFTTESQTIENILSAADIACFAAKEHGRNRIHVYSREDQELVNRRIELDWVSEIRQSIENDRFALYYQPIVASDEFSQRSNHYEILIRMLDANDDLVLPGTIIAAAERYHMMPQLDRWVINKVFEHYDNGHLFKGIEPFVVAINLSGVSLADSDLLAYIETKIKHSRLPPEYICFEITETAAISNMSVAVQFINRMRALGCKFAIDDFGSGVSSLAYLKNLPVDYVKIDGSFVRDMANDPIDYAMVESIHKLVSLNGKYSIAEYVESDEILEKLKIIGVDYLQGYAIAKPQPLISQTRKSKQTQKMQSASINEEL